MRPVPVPRRAHDRLEVAVARRPVQFALRLLRSRVEHRRVARPPRAECPWHWPAGDAMYGVDHLAHRMRMAGTEIVGARFAGFGYCLEREDVRGGKVRDMDIVAQARAVRRRIVVAE